MCFFSSLQCQLKPLHLKPPHLPNIYIVEYFFQIITPRACPLTSSLPKNSLIIEPDRRRRKVAAQLQLTCTFQFPTGKKKLYWYMEQISPCPSSRKECYFCCDCTFTQTGLPLVQTCLSILRLTRDRAKGQLHITSVLSGATLPTWDKSCRESNYITSLSLT